MTSAELDALYDEIAPLADRFSNAGFNLYLVGGIVRNHLAEQLVDLDDRVGFVDLDDIDMTTDAKPGEIKAIVADWFEAVWTQGERFGTIGGRRGQRVYEITTHRAERYQSDSRKPAVKFSTAVIDDLGRRDFTVNAMALTVPGRDLIDPFDGQADLAAKRLRTPRDPDISFTDDPLRMLRAARFITRFGLTPDDALVESVGRLAGRLEIVSAERVRDELHKLLRSPEPTVGLCFLENAGLLEIFWPEADPAALDRIRAVSPKPELRIAAAMIGCDDGAVVARLKALRSSNDDVRRTRALVWALTKWSRVRGPVSDEMIRRFALRVGGAFADLVEMGVALELPFSQQFDEAASRLEQQGELDDLGPELTGEQVMRLLDLGPGPWVGEVLAELGELRLKEGRHEQSDLEDKVRTYWASRPVR